MLRWLPLLLGLLAGSVWSAESVQQQVRQVEAALARISQEQQSIYQQFNMVQELRRNNERQLLPLAPNAAPGTPPNYDEFKRQDEARAQRVRDLQSEVDRLYARYRQLEEQKKPLLEALSALAQQRPQEQTAERAPPEQREPPIAR
jgi:hypothetical protein